MVPEVIEVRLYIGRVLVDTEHIPRPLPTRFIKFGKIFKYMAALISTREEDGAEVRYCIYKMVCDMPKGISSAELEDSLRPS